MNASNHPEILPVEADLSQLQRKVVQWICPHCEHQQPLFIVDLKPVPYKPDQYKVGCDTCSHLTTLHMDTVLGMFGTVGQDHKAAIYTPIPSPCTESDELMLFHFSYLRHCRTRREVREFYSTVVNAARGEGMLYERMNGYPDLRYNGYDIPDQQFVDGTDVHIDREQGKVKCLFNLPHTTFQLVISGSLVTLFKWENDEQTCIAEVPAIFKQDQVGVLQAIRMGIAMAKAWIEDHKYEDFNELPF